MYDNIASGAIASWDVTGIAQTYAHLQLMIAARGDTAAAATQLNLRFNGDSAANYYTDGLTASAAAASAIEQLAQTSGRASGMTAATANANYAGCTTVMIYNYAGTTFRKNFSSQGGRVTANSTTNITPEYALGFWDSTAAINQITVLPGAGNWIAGSRLTIYGLT